MIKSSLKMIVVFLLGGAFFTVMLRGRPVKAELSNLGSYTSQEIPKSGTRGMGAATTVSGEIRGYSCATESRHGESETECYALVKK
jgi:hypothetical protein